LTISALHAFAGPDGIGPQGPLLLASDGNFYGTTSTGGDDGQGCVHGCYGTVFKMTRAGQLSVLHTFAYGSAAAPFPDGCIPLEGLVEAPDGFLYGTTFGSNGPCSNHYGTIFKISKTGELHTLYTFCTPSCTPGGGAPVGALAIGRDGNFYGATTWPDFAQTIFRITPGGAYTVVASFFNLGIGGPTGGLLLASDGNFYGLTSSTIYRVTPAGQITSLYTFGTQPNDGSRGIGALIQATDGNLYGVTSLGLGNTGAGAVFRISLNGAYQKIFTLTAANDGLGPSGLLQASDGNLWITTANTSQAGRGGAVFAITTSGVPVVSAFFNKNTTGDEPLAPLIQGCDGKLYGTGAADGLLDPHTPAAGTIFSVDAGLTSAHPCASGRRNDFNGDGNADIVWRNGQSGENGIWLMNGYAIAGAAGIPSAPPPWQIAGIGDFDGDGNSDILWRNPSTGDDGVWLMNGTSIKSAASIPGAGVGWIVAGVADFDGDGHADILWRNSSTGENGLWLMNGFTIAGAAAIPGAAVGWIAAGVADLNGDGRSDIVWRNPSTGENGVWLMNGYAIQAAQALPAAAPAWIVAGVADFDGDGKADILWRNPATTEDGLWLMSGATILAAQALPGAGPGWIVAETDDFNGDGRADILWRNPQTGEDGLWLMNGFAIQGAQAIPGAGVGWEAR
jgi:uncharacterized repeat protein (TIGR03803 family)